MSAYQILIEELARGNGVTTYATLMRRHGDEYDRPSFAVAVYKARKKGIALDDPGKGKPIVAAGNCPCCGRKL